jgi:hypothetical protein
VSKKKNRKGTYIKNKQKCTDCAKYKVKGKVAL